MIFISIGIVTFNNTEQELKQWLNSLEIAFNAALEIEKNLKISLYFIDNGNETTIFDSVEYALRVPSQGNIGYTKAINLLIEEALKNNLVTHFQSANPDGAFHPYFFLNMIKFIKMYPDSIIESSQFPEEHPKYYDPINFDTVWASGAATLYPISVIKMIGLMDHNFFMYCEDVDYSWRARMNGISIKHCPNAKYGHHVINRQPSMLTTKYMYESGRYLALKWNSNEFALWCERILIEQNIYEDMSELPKYNIEFSYNSKNIDEIVDFKNHFYFSKGRW